MVSWCTTLNAPLDVLVVAAKCQIQCHLFASLHWHLAGADSACVQWFCSVGSIYSLIGVMAVKCYVAQGLLMVVLPLCTA